MAKQKLINERNELAKQLCIHNDMSSDSCLNEANRMMSLLYGDSWNNENEHDNVTDCQSDTNPIVSIAEQDGQKGVRFCIGDIDIFIEAHDLDEDGKKFKWDEAMKKLKAYGKRTFDKHEMYLIAAFKDEINAALREIGGAEMDTGYWSSTEYNSGYAWPVYFSSGNIYGSNKYYTYVVRPVAAFKHE